mmetsp:Transcript_6581/g.13141  ORF Transcript_6581/g.13141 Transcript_6581/m.13141 type:complete len:131 (-) Transcript_6581:42-434(-)
MLLAYGAMDQLQLRVRIHAEALQRGETRTPDPYLGVLMHALVNTEDCNIFGYISASNVKVLAIVRDTGDKQREKEDVILRSLLRQLHHFYVDAACNPFFQGLGRPSFAASVATAVERHAARLTQLAQVAV